MLQKSRFPPPPTSVTLRGPSLAPLKCLLSHHQSWELAAGRRGGLSFEMLIFSRFCCGKWKALRVLRGDEIKNVVGKNKPKADTKFFTTLLAYRYSNGKSLGL
jgi:hypothetical protein